MKKSYLNWIKRKIKLSNWKRERSMILKISSENKMRSSKLWIEKLTKKGSYMTTISKILAIFYKTFSMWKKKTKSLEVLTSFKAFKCKLRLKSLKSSCLIVIKKFWSLNQRDQTLFSIWKCATKSRTQRIRKRLNKEPLWYLKHPLKRRAKSKGDFLINN
jgi:hypothetical protein